MRFLFPLLLVLPLLTSCPSLDAALMPVEVTEMVMQRDDLLTDLLDEVRAGDESRVLEVLAQEVAAWKLLEQEASFLTPYDLRDAANSNRIIVEVVMEKYEAGEYADEPSLLIDFLTSLVDNWKNLEDYYGATQ